MSEKVINQPLRTVLGSLLVGGTALGAGMLALPLATAGSGLLPTWFIYLLTWSFSVCTGLLFVEIALWMPDRSNIVSMASFLLGKWGAAAAWILYIFLFYFLTIAYVAGGGKLTAEIFGPACPSYLGILAFTIFFGSFVYMGAKASGKINALLMVGLILSYFGFAVVASKTVEPHHWLEKGWGPAFLGLPIIFTSFSYQGVVPTLLEYLQRDVRKMKIAIIAGTAIPFIAYLLWDFLIKGLVPVDGPHGLLAAKAAGLTSIDPLFYHLGNSTVFVIGKFFAFFALTTSFIGVTLGLRDFLTDSLNVKRSPTNLLGLCLVIFVPPVIISLVNPTIFLTALGLAGGFGCALLLGMMPIVMAFVGRYRKQCLPNDRVLGGGKALLAILFCFVLFEVVMEIISEFIA